MARVPDADRQRRSRRLVPWTPETRALLGRVPDRDLAQRLGTSLHLVVVERNRHGIQASRPAAPVTWTPEMLAAIGTAPDSVLAKQWGISGGIVRLKRLELGRPGGRITPVIEWTPDMVRDLAALSLRAFARTYGVNPNQVLVERRRRGITPRHQRRPMPEEHLALLGTIPDKAFAARFGYDPQYVGTYRVRCGIASHRQRRYAFVWTPYRLSCLGKHADAALARRWGIHVDTVFRKRRELGRQSPRRKAVWTAEMRAAVQHRPARAVMALYRLTMGQVCGMRKRLGIQRSQRRFSPAEDLMIGSAPDRDIARLLGRDVNSVADRRRRLGKSCRTSRQLSRK